MMGTALCTPIADAGHEVRLVGTHLDRAWVEGMTRDRVHPKLGVPLPRRVTPYPFERLREAMGGVELVVSGVSSAGVRWTAEHVGPYLSSRVPVIAVTKGLELEPPCTLRVLPDVFRSHLPPSVQDQVEPAAIGGPCIAGELARRVPTCVVFTGRDAAVLRRFQQAFGTSYYHVRTSTDVLGVEVCAALKNAFAMAVGIGAGVHERSGGKPGPVALHNFEAGIFSQACIEMLVLVRALGGDAQNVPHLPGAGDMLVTTSGGRSSRLGRLLGLGHTFAEAREQMKADTLESADIVRVVGGALDQLEAHGVIPRGSMPLMRHLHDIIERGAAVAMPFASFF
jgi:glycerol-3-phosphate dehydrogenase (NAD(P)+)